MIEVPYYLKKPNGGGHGSFKDWGFKDYMVTACLGSGMRWDFETLCEGDVIVVTSKDTNIPCAINFSRMEILEFYKKLMKIDTYGGFERMFGPVNSGKKCF
ncbi:MAG: hypothetical protein KKG60_03555 [Nanoarchaeota archaeon]|nr:hypothetical protein [Nanoarchaeota archaeon]